MGKIKLETKPRSEKALHKTASHLQENLSLSKKSAKSTKKDCEEVDSLMFLKEEKDKSKTVGLDEKLKFLKSQLQELLGDVKTESSDLKCLNSFDGSIVDVSSSVLEQKSASLELNSRPVEISNDQQNASKPDIKFSKWLEQSIDNMTVKSEGSEDLCYNLPSNTKKSPVIELKFKSRLFNSSSFSNNLLEQLVYKSIYLQNFEKHLSSSDEDDFEEIKFVKKVKQQKTSANKPLKKSFNQKFCKSSQKTRNTRSRSIFKSNIEIVDLICNSPYNNNNSVLEVHEDSEIGVENYDWNEPFDIESQSEISSPVKVSDITSKNNKDKPDLDNPEVQNHEDSILNTPVGKLKVQRNWECPICFDQSRGQDVVATQCGHIFCKKCLERHMSKLKNKNCPTCRTDLSKKPPITLFNF